VAQKEKRSGEKAQREIQYERTRRSARQGTTPEGNPEEDSSDAHARDLGAIPRKKPETKPESETSSETSGSARKPILVPRSARGRPTNAKVASAQGLRPHRATSGDGLGHSLSSGGGPGS
jgi:hypothetical protein